MRAIKMTATVGVHGKGDTVSVGNKSALYLVEHGYAEYDKGEKNLPRLVKKRAPKRARVDALTSEQLHGNEGQ
jgi:hypothetical protein